MRWILSSLLILLIATNAHALRINKPETYNKEWDEPSVIRLNGALEEIYNMQNGRYQMNILTETPDNVTNGEFWIDDQTDDPLIHYVYNSTIYQVLGQQASSTNYVEVESDGTIVMNGDATVWDDLRVPVSSVKRIGNSDPDWEVFKNGVYGLAFASNVDQEIMFTVQIPHKWKIGTDLDPHVHWAPSSTDTGSVTWALEYTIADINGTFGNTTTMTKTHAGSGTAYNHQYADFADIDMSGYTDAGDVSIILVCRLYRDVDNGDDYADDAFLLEIDFHYEIDTIGSRTEMSK